MKDAPLSKIKRVHGLSLNIALRVTGVAVLLVLVARLLGASLPTVGLDKEG